MLIVLAITLPIFVVAVIFLSKQWLITNKQDRTKGFIYVGGTILISLLLCAATYYGGTFKSRFSEIGNCKIMSMQHEEKWTTKERHEETYEVVVGHDENGDEITETRTRVWYETETHGPYWTAYDEYGEFHSIDRGLYNKWSDIWDNNTRVGQHNGSAAGFDTSITGGIYQSKWTGNFDTIYPWEEVWTYENKLRVTETVLKFPEPTEAMVKRFPRPADQGNTMPVITYGPVINDAEMMLLRRTNAVLGKPHQIHCIIMLFDASKDQQNVVNDVLSAWQGPNMNELVWFIGLDQNRKVVWSEAQSWMDNTEIHVRLQQKAFKMGTFDAEKISSALSELVPQYWKRKDFKKDFDYLDVPIGLGWYIVCIILFFGVCIGGYFAVEYGICRVRTYKRW